MGFLDVCKSVVGYISEKNQKMQAEYDRYRDLYENESDSRLMSLAKGSTGMKKVAVLSLLRDRGYGNEDIGE